MTRKELFEKWESRIDVVGESPYDFFKSVGMELPPEDALVFLEALKRDPFYAMKVGIALGAEWQVQQFIKDKAKGATP